MVRAESLPLRGCRSGYMEHRPPGGTASTGSGTLRLGHVHDPKGSHAEDRRRRRGRHRHGVHRHGPRRGAAPDRRAGPRRPGQHAGARRRPRADARRRRAPTPSLDDLLADPTRGRRPRHVAQRPPPAADPGDPRRRPARRVREAAGDVGDASPRELVELAAAVGARERRRTSTSATTRSTSTPTKSSASRRDRRRPARHRPLLPGLAAARDRLELAPPAGARRSAAGGRRHRLALARPDDVRHRPSHRRRHGRARHVHRCASRADRPGRDLLDGGRRRDRRLARSRPRTPPRSCSASTMAPAAPSTSARSAPAGRTRCSTRSTGRSPRSRGTRSSPTRCGSAIASAPTRSSSRTPR